jgi:hypothetical protein
MALNDENKDRRDYHDRLDRQDLHDHQDYCDSQSHQRLAKLRSVGYSEAIFSLTKPTHLKEYQDIIAELGFHHFFYEAVKLEGDVVVLFMSQRVAECIGIQTRRNEVKKALREPRK